METILLMNEKRCNYQDTFKMYHDGYIREVVDNNQNHITQVMSHLTYLQLVDSPIQPYTARYYALGLEIYHMLEKIMTFGDTY
ncbi:MAG TPA: hypothetical protein PLS49_08125 [Candidatus Woesebacteria bacterium]|nr:hypothetical protein [Candidatus Woesebacteria bacterium]